MSREYVLSARNQTIVGAITALWINPSATRGFKVLQVWAGVVGVTTPAMVPVQLVTQLAVFPTLTTGLTPKKLKQAETFAASIVPGTTGAAGTAGMIATAEGAGVKTSIVDDVMNVLNGWNYRPRIGEEISLPANAAYGFGLFFPVVPGTTAGWSFGAAIRET